MSPKRRLIAAFAALTVGALPVVAASPAAAAPATGLLRVAVLSPNAGPLGVALDGKPVVENAPFTTVAPYGRVAAGAHTLTVTSGSTIATTKTFTVAAGKDFSAFVLGPANALTVSVFDDLVTTPAKGAATVRLLHAAPGVPAVDVDTAASKARLFSNVAYNVPTAYQPVPGGTYDITMARAGTTQVLWTVRGVAVKAGSAYTLAAVGGAGRTLQVLPLVDATGTGAVPTGGIDTGYGGGVHGNGAAAMTTAVAGLWVLAAACAAGALAAWRRPT